MGDDIDDDDTNRPGVDAVAVGRIIQTFATLADSLVHDVDLPELLGGIAAEAVRLLPVDGAVVLVDRDNKLELAAASDPAVQALAEIELAHRSGPGIDAARGQDVHALTDPLPDAPLLDTARAETGVRAGTWPSYAAAVLAAGYKAVYAMPLRERDASIGALDLFSLSSSPLTDCDLQLAQALADLAALAVVQHEQAGSAALAGQLQQALNTRIVVEQAKGVIAEHAAVDMATAFSAIRSYARARQLKLSSVARAVVDRKIHPGEVIGTDPRSRGVTRR